MMSRVRRWPSISINRVGTVSLSCAVLTTDAVAALFSGGMQTEGGRVCDGVLWVNSPHSGQVGCGDPTGVGSARTGSLFNRGALAGVWMGSPSQILSWSDPLMETNFKTYNGYLKQCIRFAKTEHYVHEFTKYKDDIRKTSDTLKDTIDTKNI